MIDVDLHIPVLLQECVEKHGLAKTASIVDAIIGAPVGAAAAHIAADEENKGTAAQRGLVVGALLGFLAGQEAVQNAIQGVPTPPYKHPVAASAAGGAATGLLSRYQSAKKKQQNQ